MSTRDRAHASPGSPGRQERSRARSRRRRRLLATAMLCVAGFAAVAGWVVLRPQQEAKAAPPPGVRVGAASEAPSLVAQPASPASPAPGSWPAFAEVEGLRLIVPSQKIDIVAFHEASYPDAMEMLPLGRMKHNYNRTKFASPAPSAGTPYIVQTSRGRVQPATSAADVVLSRTTPVLTPVSGTVVTAKRYKLYGMYPDMRVEIKPDGFPNLRVVIIHLDDVTVQRGDEVSATLSPLGMARVFPFDSVVNAEVASDHPHVHIEVKERDATPTE